MEDRRTSPAPADTSPTAALIGPLKRCAACLAIASTLWAASGCSLFVMAGKMLFGDPLRTAAFHSATKVDLTKGEKSVLIVATTPQSTKNELPGVDFKVVEEVSRRLRVKGIKVYPSQKVLNWVDNRGGQWGTADEIAAKFDADFIVEIDVDRLSFREENSPDLFRGQAIGNVRAYEVVAAGDTRLASSAFSREFSCTYPTHHPKQAHQISEDTFRQQFLERVCTHIAQLFYDHRMSETVY